ncbi:MAG: hypothetical protein ACE5NJ_09225 [Thermodesulfobacteriota bacterium]
MNEEILSQLEQLLKQEIKDFRGDFAELEQAVMRMMMSLGKGLLQRFVDNNTHGYQGSNMLCNCGGWMKFIQHRPRDIHSLFGWIKLRRAYYHCSDWGTGLAPYDKASGLGSQQISPALAKARCILAVDNSFEQVSEEIQQLYGQRVCDDVVECGWRLADVGLVMLKRWFLWAMVPLGLVVNGVSILVVPRLS